LIYFIYCIGNSIYRVILYYDNKYVEYYVKTFVEKQKESLEKFEINEYSFMSENEIRDSFYSGRVTGIYIAVIVYILYVNINKYFYIKLYIYIPFLFFIIYKFN